MNPETQKSIETHNDEALALINDVNERTIPVTPSAEIIPFPVERVRADVAVPAEEAVTLAPEAEPKKNKLGLIAGVGTAALLALGFFPRSGEAPAPTPVPDTLIDQAQESAQTPYDPSTDELVIGNIRVKPGNPELNSPSQAVLNNSEVKTFIAANPGEATSIEASSMVLPSNASGEYAVVARDVDDDGDTDAVAVPSGK